MAVLLDEPKRWSHLPYLDLRYKVRRLNPDIPLEAESILFEDSPASSWVTSESQVARSHLQMWIFLDRSIVGITYSARLV